MPSVRNIDYKKKSIFSKIKEMLPDSATVQTPFGLFVKHPGNLLVDANTAVKAENDYKNSIAQKNLKDATIMSNFNKKTVGLNSSMNDTPNIAHGVTKDSSNYPHQKNNVYEDIPKTKDFFKSH